MPYNKMFVVYVYAQIYRTKESQENDLENNIN